MKQLRLKACLVLALCVLSQTACADKIDVKTVKDSLEKNPRAALAQHFSCDRYEGSAYEKISSGDPAWIAIAEQGLKHSDACYTSGIQASLGAAMRKAPRSVLRLVDKTPALSAKYICLPFISNEQPFATQLAEIQASKAAIRQVEDADLRQQKAACVRFIEEVETALRNGAAVK